MTRGAVTPEPIEKLAAAWRKERVPPEIIKRRVDLPGEERVGGRTVERINSRCSEPALRHHPSLRASDRSKSTGSVAGTPCQRRVQSRKMWRMV